MPMATDLDVAYEAMKKAPDPVDVSGEAERFQRGAADAMAKYFAALLWDEAHKDGHGTDTYEAMYHERGSKAMVLITVSMEAVRDLARGDKAALDAFLNGVMQRAQT